MAAKKKPASYKINPKTGTSVKKSTPKKRKHKPAGAVTGIRA